MKNESLKLLNIEKEDLPLIYGKKKQIITNTSDAYKLLKRHFDKSDINKKESFKVLLLNEKFEVLKVSDISQGNRGECYINVRKLFKDIFLNNAEKIIICHNHPSKNLSPTSEDNKFTLGLKEICEYFGIGLLNHIIISSGGYYSYLHDDNK